MSENVSFIQGSKENYNPSEMQGGLFLSKDTKEILLNGESYGNATPADEEDITAESGNIKLKDRAYDAANFSGKGYKILRKNLVLLDDGSYKNVLTSSMISEPNTIYEVRYDFDLNGGTITPKENSEFVYSGGTINNGTVNITYPGIIIRPNGSDIVFRRSVESIMLLEDLSYYGTNVTGMSDAVLSKDKTSGVLIFHDTEDLSHSFHLDGRGHGIIGISDCRMITPNLYVENTIFGAPDLGNIGFGTYYTTSLTKNAHGKLICKNCTFYNLTNLMTAASYIEFTNCKFVNCSLHIGLRKSEYEQGCNVNSRFIGCEFYAGPNNVNNTEVIHILFHGWEGSTVIEGCTFHAEEDLGIGDLIDGYDSCNITITNNNFIYKYIPNSGEGTVNIKSHSLYTAEEVDWAFVDTIGHKYNTIITNNNFTIIAEESNESRINPVIWVRSYKRDTYTELDIWNPRYNFCIANNNLYVRCNFSSTVGGALVFNLDTLDNATITGNNIVIEGSCTDGYFSVFEHQAHNGELANVIVTNNTLRQIGLGTYSLYCIRIGGFSDDRTSNFINVIARLNTLIGKIATNVNLELYAQICILDNSCYDTGLQRKYGAPIVEDLSHIYKFDAGSLQYILSENKLGILLYSGEVLDVFGNPIESKSFGTSAQRPSGIILGFQYFDTTWNKPIYWNGTGWVTSDGLDADSTGWATIE